MKSTVRKIGNSHSVLIPPSFIVACKMESKIEIELRLDGSRIVIEPAGRPRAGWFDGYQRESDEDVWPPLSEDESDGDEEQR